MAAASMEGRSVAEPPQMGIWASSSPSPGSAFRRFASRESAASAFLNCSEVTSTSPACVCIGNLIL